MSSCDFTPEARLWLPAWHFPFGKSQDETVFPRSDDDGGHLLPAHPTAKFLQPELERRDVVPPEIDHLVVGIVSQKGEVQTADVGGVGVGVAASEAVEVKQDRSKRTELYLAEVLLGALPGVNVTVATPPLGAVKTWPGVVVRTRTVEVPGANPAKP